MGRKQKLKRERKAAKNAKEENDALVGAFLNAVAISGEDNDEFEENFRRLAGDEAFEKIDAEIANKRKKSSREEIEALMIEPWPVSDNLRKIGQW